MTAQNDLENVTVEQALKLYLTDISQEKANSTVNSHRSRLQFFKDWFQDETNYNYLCELTGMDIQKWKLWRFDNSEKDYSRDTIATHMDTLRVFIKYCSNLDAVPESLPQKIKSPPRKDGQRSNEIQADRATEILKYLDRYRYASLDHVLAHLLWYAMIRIGAARSIDLQDIDLSDGFISLSHDPTEGTPLKNGKKSERVISIEDTTCRILDDYIEQNRVQSTDAYGREPLFTTERGGGRAHVTTLRNRIYALTRPCIYKACPHDRDPESCEAAQKNNSACKCPSSESTHAIRRGSISWHLREETPVEVVSDRADVSHSVIEKHYSTLTEREKAEVRSNQLPDNL